MNARRSVDQSTSSNLVVEFVGSPVSYQRLRLAPLQRSARPDRFTRVSTVVDPVNHRSAGGRGPEHGAQRQRRSLGACPFALAADGRPVLVSRRRRQRSTGNTPYESISSFSSIGRRCSCRRRRRLASAAAAARNMPRAASGVLRVVMPFPADRGRSPRVPRYVVLGGGTL